MAKSSQVIALDAIQKSLLPFFQEINFRHKGRTFNRLTEDGLTQVIGLQMWQSDPPSSTHSLGRQQDFEGRFAINLGIYVPEVALAFGMKSRDWVLDSSCCLRIRLGELILGTNDIWWPARHDDDVIADVLLGLRKYAIPYFDQYQSREQIVNALSRDATRKGGGHPPRLISAIILLERGEAAAAVKMLEAQVQDSADRPGHVLFVRELAERLGLGPLQ